MTIGNLYDSFQSSYSMQRVSNVEPVNYEKNVKPEEAAGVANVPAQTQLSEDPQRELHTGKGQTDLENISLKFNKEETYDYIGKDSSLENLDMQKAISDMKKDEILQDYQYFVGSSRNFLGGNLSGDGIVFLKQ